jgi:hypothetical protein
MSTGAIVGAVVVMVCCSASSAAAMMMGGSEEPKVEPKAEPEAEPEAEPKVEPEDPDKKVCSRNVSAKRVDAPGAGWGMNLHFKCGESTAQIGNSSTNVKTTPQPINIAKLGCPKVVNKSNWSGTDTYPDKFEINVSDCLA